MHIGLIGGIGPAATEFYYRALIDRHAEADTAFDLTIVHADVREMARNLASGDAARQAQTFAILMRRLAAAGADLAVITSMGGHFCVRELEALAPIPILNALPEVAAEIRRRSFKCVGILGTRLVMETRLYGAIGSATVVAPQGQALAEVHKAYSEMATVGRVTAAQREVFCKAGMALTHDQGAEVVLLGGTDLFLAFQGHDCGFPILDCADIHVAAVLRESLARASA
jgi:aspartate racemase